MIRSEHSKLDYKTADKSGANRSDQIRLYQIERNLQFSSEGDSVLMRICTLFILFVSLQICTAISHNLALM